MDTTNNTNKMDIYEKIKTGERLERADALKLWYDFNLLELGQLATIVRDKKHPKKLITFVIDRNINYTNICDTKCKFCAFYTVEGQENGYVLTIEQILEKVKETVELNGTQILMQGGTHPSLPFSYYLEVVKAIKGSFKVQVHSFSPPEIIHFTKISNLSIKEVLLQLRKAGLDSLPGGGAEILVDEIRKKVSPNKITTAQWLEVMDIAQAIGMKTTATMVFGLGETIDNRIDHILAIRKLQDKNNGFTAFIPWSFQPNNTELGGVTTSAVEYLKNLAISRILLDNFHNIQASWVTQGEKIAQTSLCFGSNDFGGTMLEENVVKAAGTENKLHLKEIILLIKEAGYDVAQRATDYTIIKHF